MSIFVFVSFSVVNAITFLSAFLFTAENENAFRSASSIHHKKVLGLEMQSLGLGLGLERILKFWSWS